VGGYTDWLRQRQEDEQRAATASAVAASVAPAAPPAPAPTRRKLSYKDARELEQLPLRIEQLESEIASMTAAMADPKFYQGDAGAVAAHGARLGELQKTLDEVYMRWQALEG